MRCIASDNDSTPYIQPVKLAQTDSIPTFSPLHGESIINSVIATKQPCISVSGGEDGHVVVFDWSKGSVLHRWTEHKRAVNRLAYASKTNAFFSGSRDGTVLMWQEGTDDSKQQFHGHELTVNGVAVCAPDDKMLFSGSRDWTVRWPQFILAIHITSNALRMNPNQYDKIQPRPHAWPHTWLRFTGSSAQTSFLGAPEIDLSFEYCWRGRSRRLWDIETGRQRECTKVVNISGSAPGW